MKVFKATLLMIWVVVGAVLVCCTAHQDVKPMHNDVANIENRMLSEIQVRDLPYVLGKNSM